MRCGGIGTAMTLSRHLRNIGYYQSTLPRFSFVFTIGDIEDVPGRLGRTRSDHLDTYSSYNSPYDVASNPWLEDINLYDVIDGIQYWSVPFDGYYTILAAGGQMNFTGSPHNDSSIKSKGTFLLNKDDTIMILCGRLGHHVARTPSIAQAFGGNGGTFVAIGDSPELSEPMVISGAGGNVNPRNDQINFPSFNVVRRFSQGGSSIIATAGTNGLGGQSNGTNATGGAGFFGDSAFSAEEFKARAFVNGGAGGIGITQPEIGYGGFGGGGATLNSFALYPRPLGGGGGYNGGAGANLSLIQAAQFDSLAGGRGGSFVSATALDPSVSGVPFISDFPFINNFSTDNGRTRSGRVWIEYSPLNIVI